MGKKIKLKPNKIKKELGFNYSNWLYQSFGEKKCLFVVNELTWTRRWNCWWNPFGNVAFKFQSAFIAEQQPLKSELNFRFLVLYRRSSHMYKLTSFLGLEYIWDTDRYCLWSMAKFASFWLQRISCFCCLCWSRIMSPQ